MHTPKAKNTFEDIISLNMQSEWLSQNNCDINNPKNSDISQNLDQLNRYEERYAKISQGKLYNHIIKAAALYLKNCIPFPRLTEKSFWSLSCLPQTTRGDLYRLFCFNLNKMETFVLFQSKKNPETLHSLLNLSATPLINGYGSIDNFIKTFSLSQCFVRPYVAAENDQITIDEPHFSTTLSLLTSQQVIQAAKDLNIRLMRKGKNVYHKYHCIQLADDVIGKALQ